MRACGCMIIVVHTVHAQAGEEARRKSVEAEKQEQFRKEKEAMLAAQVAKEAKDLAEVGACEFEERESECIEFRGERE